MIFLLLLNNTKLIRHNATNLKLQSYKLKKPVINDRLSAWSVSWNFTFQHFKFPIFSKRVFPAQKSNFEHHHRIQHIRFDLRTECYLIRKLWIFATNLPKKDISWTKQNKRTLPPSCELSIFELVQLPTFILNWEFWFFGSNLPKKEENYPYKGNEHKGWYTYDVHFGGGGRGWEGKAKRRCYRTSGGGG